ncbi:MAG: hypothetical protein QOC73_1070 [Actinomycetota bacterium]|jgi:hypothetical protein|nr:hypothetical protein [Actinomycetota bacterium]
MFTPRRLAKFVPALALIALAVPSSAFGQATRTWVSGVGDDANPCSRTAPCKTFAGAISKTANGGEINCLDPGGFGGVTITKSLTIKCHYTEGGVLVSGTNAIVVNATATDKVTLRGLDINGIGTGAQTSLVGVKVLSARNVNILDSEIYRFQAGIDVNPTSADTRVVVANTHIHDNGVGVINAPGNNAISATSVTVRHSNLQDNTCAAVVSSFGVNASTPNANLDCGTAAAGAISKPAILDLFHDGISYNGTGVFSRGGASATAEIAYDEITANTAFGLHRVDAGAIRTFTPATNVISNNAATDAPSTTAALTKRHAKRIGR